MLNVNTTTHTFCTSFYYLLIHFTAKTILETLGLPVIWEAEKINIEDYMKRNSNDNSNSSMPPPPPPPSRHSIQSQQSRYNFQNYRQPNSNNLRNTNDSPHVVPPTQDSNYARVSQQVSQIPQRSSGSSSSTHWKRSEDPPILSGELFSDVDINSYQQGLVTSTQNSAANAPVLSFHTNQDNGEAEVETEILSPIIGSVDSDGQLERFGNLIRTPTQSIPKKDKVAATSVQGNGNNHQNQSHGTKRKREDCNNRDKTKESTRTPPQSTDGDDQTSSSNESYNGSGEGSFGSVMRHSVQSNLQRFKILPKSQD